MRRHVENAVGWTLILALFAAIAAIMFYGIRDNRRCQNACLSAEHHQIHGVCYCRNGNMWIPAQDPSAEKDAHDYTR